MTKEKILKIVRGEKFTPKGVEGYCQRPMMMKGTRSKFLKGIPTVIILELWDSCHYGNKKILVL